MGDILVEYIIISGVWNSRRSGCADCCCHHCSFGTESCSCNFSRDFVTVTNDDVVSMHSQTAAVMNRAKLMKS